MDAIKETHTEEIQEMINLGKQTGATDVNIINRIYEMKEKILVIEDMVEEVYSLVKEKCKYKKF